MRHRGQCKTCAHPERARIELQCCNGVTHARVAMQFGISSDSVWRHMRRHTTAEARAKLKLLGLSDSKVDVEALKRSESESLLQNLIGERVRLSRLADRAESIGSIGDATRASRAIIDVLGLVGKVLGELNVGRVTVHQSVVMSADWFRLRGVLASALRPFPAAQAAVLQALRDYERSQGVDVNGARAIELPREALEYERKPAGA